MTAGEIIQKYISFFEERGHKQIENTPLVPKDDPSTLFTSAGMQPLIPYLLGEPHPQGNRLVNVQNCFRAVDIDEVGDDRHTTFFRMLGNWSLGEYFKKEEIPWLWEFLTEELNLPKEKLHVTVFEGNEIIPRDEESLEIWKSLGIDENRLHVYGVEKNWWSRSGKPDFMPIGEIGGPSTEVFYEFNVTHNPKLGEKCHPNCDCGRFFEIANSVFIQYKKIGGGKFEKLTQQNVDFGGGLERLLCAVNNDPDMFKTTLFDPIVKAIEKTTSRKYQDHKKDMQIIADHLTAASFIILEGIKPSNKEQGYVLRRLIRRAFHSFDELKGKDVNFVLQQIIFQYKETDPQIESRMEGLKQVIGEEKEVYKMVFSESNIKNIEKQIPDPNNIDASKSFVAKALEKYTQETNVELFMEHHTLSSLASVAVGTVAFEAQSSLGFPLDGTLGIAQKKLGGQLVPTETLKTFDVLRQKHQQISRRGSAEKFERKSVKG